MKKRNSFAILSLAGVAVLGMTACNSGEEPGPEEHQHSFSELHEKVDPTCLTEGREAYYTCDECDKIFNENKEEISEVVAIPTIAHVPHHHEGVAPGCETPGTGEYWTCDNEVDDKLYGDAQCTQVISEVPVLEATGHDLELQEGQDSTCTEAGWKDWYVCEHCGNLYEDNEGTTLISNLDAWKQAAGKIDAKGHNATLVEGQEPTKTEAGWKDYYECSRCHKLFEDAAAETEITNLDEWKQNAGCLPATWVSVTSISLATSSDSIERGGTATLSVTVLPENADDKSYDISIISGGSYISLNGNTVTGVAAGTAKLKAVAKDGAVASNEVEITVYTVPVTLTVNGGNGGGSYLKGDSVTVTPEVLENKEFVAWKNGEDVVSTDSSYTFTITADTELTAEFKYTDAYLERNDMFYTLGADIIAWNPDEAVSAVTEGLTEDSVFGYKMTAGRGQFHLRSSYDLTTSKVVFDIKAKEANTKVSVRFHNSSWGDVENSTIEVYAGTEWASYDFAPAQVSDDDLTEIMLFTINLGSGAEILMDNLRIEDATNDEWYVERNDLGYKMTVAEEKAGNVFEKVTEGLQDGSAAAIAYHNTDTSSSWPSILLRLPEAVDLTKNKLVLDANVITGSNYWFSLKFYDSHWEQYASIGEIGNDLTPGQWNTLEYGRYAGATDVKFIRICINNDAGNNCTLLLDNIHLDSNNYITASGSAYIQLLTPFTADETFGKALQMDYKLDGGSASGDYAHVVLMNEGWKNITGEIDLRGDGTTNKNGKVTDLGNGWRRVIIDVQAFNGDGSPRNAITHFRLEKCVGETKGVTIDCDTLGFVDFTREYEYDAGGALFKGIDSFQNWHSKKIIIDCEPGDGSRGGQKFVLGLRDANNTTLGKFTIRLQDHVAKKGNNGADIATGVQVEGNVYHYEIDLSLVDIESGDGTDPVVSLNAEEAWMDMIVHSFVIA